MPIIPVIICGGAGTRLWPVSRELLPKPLLRLADGQSLFQKTLSRACNLQQISNVLIVSHRDTYFLLKDECQPQPTEVETGYILEPVARNTAAAIATAAAMIREKHGEDTLMLVLPADHLIKNEAVFHHAVEQAAIAAQQGWLVTFGAKPTKAETGFGYLQFDPASMADSPADPNPRTPRADPCDVHRVIRFIEKPSAEIAQTLIADGQHLWNTGMFCFTAQTILAELTAYAPNVIQPATDAVAASQRSQTGNTYAIELDRKTFERAENISIDYAVMERSSKVAVVCCDLDWCDIGSWQSLSELTPADACGNRVDGAASLYDVDNCYVRASDRFIAMIGVQDLMIVDTPDALLVAHRDRAQDVKHIVTHLKQNGHDAYKLHRTVHRPWGTYTVLEEGERFKIKRIIVKPGASLSLQLHHHRSEHWVVVRGCAQIINGDKTMALQPNESTYIPAGHQHRLINPGVVELILIEVQCGEYLGEDDIVRFDDQYGRLEKKADVKF